MSRAQTKIVMGPKSHKLGGGQRGNLQFDANTLYAVRRDDALELIAGGFARPHEPGDVELDEAFALANPPPPPSEPEPEPVQIDLEEIINGLHGDDEDFAER